MRNVSNKRENMRLNSVNLRTSINSELLVNNLPNQRL